jgi:hypothetical protein
LFDEYQYFTPGPYPSSHLAIRCVSNWSQVSLWASWPLSSAL